MKQKKILYRKKLRKKNKGDEASDRVPVEEVDNEHDPSDRSFSTAERQKDGSSSCNCWYNNMRKTIKKAVLQELNFATSSYMTNGDDPEESETAPPTADGQNNGAPTGDDGTDGGDASGANSEAALPVATPDVDSKADDATVK